MKPFIPLILIISLGILPECRQPERPVANNINGEQYRPQIHFTPPYHWMNDPNGMVYYAGIYHLFYQYFPDSNVWGPMHWGHAFSKDLLHWKHMAVALYPDSLGYIFSGSAVVDVNNTSGFGSLKNPPLVAIFTYHNPDLEKSGSDRFQYQGIAFSLDSGRTWTKYKHNPVLNNPGIRDFRDPKVCWYEPGHCWIMTLATLDHITFYSSPDLIQWKKESEFGQNAGAHGGVWECPDLFPLSVPGSGEQKWVLIVNLNPGGPNGGSATQYFTGNFDGHIFSRDDEITRWVDWGKDEYAGVTWSGIPPKDGRRIFIGWMSNWQYADKVPTLDWRGALTLPRELTLMKTKQGYWLNSKPARETEDLRDKKTEINLKKVEGVADITGDLSFHHAPIELMIRFHRKNYGKSSRATQFGIRLSNDRKEEIKAGYDANNHRFFVDRRKSGIVDFSQDFPGVFTEPDLYAGDTIDMHFFIDVASLELFAQKGAVTLTDIFFPSRPYDRLAIFSEGGKVSILSCKVWKLNPVW